MWIDTELTCPICGNKWHFMHTFRTEPALGSCEKCMTHFNSGINARGMIEHRRPKTLYHVRPVPEHERL